MPQQVDIAKVKKLLKNESITLVGIMGVGKSTIGRNIAQILDLPFYDSDREIEKSATLCINDLFIHYGETEFRALEKRVINRILKEKSVVMAAGGGAFAFKTVHDIMKKNSITIWLRTELKVILSRLERKQNRPLLLGKKYDIVVKNLLNKRREFYNEADIKVNCGEQDIEIATNAVLKALQNYLELKYENC